MFIIFIGYVLLALIICGGLRRPQYAADLPIYVPLTTSSDPLGFTPRKVAFGLSKNEYYDAHSVRRLCIVKLIAQIIKISDF